jgi:uncharacterized protein (TIGR03437 family)
MCHKVTILGRGWVAGLLLSALLGGAMVSAQTALRTSDRLRPDWRRIGNSALELSLASLASGPADRVWFASDGSLLYVRTRSGMVFQTRDFERWQPSSAAPPPLPPDAAVSSGAPPADVRAVRAGISGRLYAYGGQVYRSDDGGAAWANLTAYQRESIIGGGMTDLAVSPRDPDEVVVSNQFGVWRSLDGGVSWTGLNEALPNLPARRFRGLPQGSRGVRVIVQDRGAIEWAPGEKQAWRPVRDSEATQEIAARHALSESLGAEITALSQAGDIWYAGASDGRIWVSMDRGRDWRTPWQAEGGPVQDIFTDPKDPRVALAALATEAGGVGGQRLLRTLNAGQFWDDLTSDLPETRAHAVTADPSTGTVYLATDRGVFFTRADLLAAGPPTSWTPLAGNLPAAPALDVKLDPEGNQLFVLLQGYGIYATLAPHRIGNLRLVNAADLSQRPAAPGSLLSVLGGRIQAARAGELVFPVLAASQTESQIQVPFEAQGRSVALAVEEGSRRVLLGLPLQNVSPAIFVDREGTPLVLNADSGVLLDAMNPARSNSRVQILTTGLGKVRPDWPTGLPGPVENPPQVVVTLRAYLDRAPVEVTRAVLAAGFVGLYLVEVQLPAILNAGPAELYLEAEGLASNRVRIYLEP